MRQKNPVVHSPLAITQLIWLPGTWRRMRKGVTLALESNTVSRAPTRRPADITSKQRITHTVLLRVSEKMLNGLFMVRQRGYLEDRDTNWL